MKKDEFNTEFREQTHTLSPRQSERDLISEIYESICDFLGADSCLQIGSYPRFTAITPVHDLDVLYIIGSWDENHHDPTTILKDLASRFNEYINPTDYSVELAPLQTHSIGILFKDNSGEEVFSVDIVPAYIFSKNEFDEDTYKIPEVATRRHGKNRIEYYQELSEQRREIGWIASDPRGYIHIAFELDQTTNGEFRKTAKIIKRWKNNLAEEDESLKLKSFHVEQVIVSLFQENIDLEIFDVVFKFFMELSEIIDNPNQIKDRADNDKFVDGYLVQFTEEQKDKIKCARDGFLIKLENYDGNDTIEELLEIWFHSRKPAEEFLFDKGLKTFIDTSLKFKIDGFVKPLTGFSSGWLAETPHLQKGLTRGGSRRRYIQFRIRRNDTNASEYRWKVRNCDTCAQPRGEITPNQTKNDSESTEYAGDHFVECYAIQGDTCIAKSKVPVKIL